MKIDYKKDLHHNYMIITEESEKPSEPYCIKMLIGNSIEGVLPFEQRRIDNQVHYYYDITAKQSISNLLDKKFLNYEKVKNLIYQILKTIENAYEYLLTVDDFVLLPEMIYLNITTEKPSLCFLSGYHIPISEQISNFMEYIMNKVNYNDKEAVLLVYGLYAASKKDGITLEHLKDLLHKKIDVSGHEFRTREGKKEERQMEELLSDITFEDSVNNERIIDKNKESFSNNSSGHSYLCNREKTNENTITNMIKRGIKKTVNGCNTIVNKNHLVNITNQAPNYIHSTGTNRTFKQNNQEILSSNIPVMMEKLEHEEEIPCYPVKTYLYTVCCILGGVTVIVISILSKILYNSFGNRIDMSKFFGLCLLVLCMEGYLIKRIWDQKNRITKIVTKQEYIDPRVSTIDNEPTLGRSNNLNHSMDEYDIRNWDTKEETRKESISLFNNTLKDSGDNEEDNNPTCILNEGEELPKIILKPLDEVQYQSITIDDFPFFIGKLKKNVDYCLEKDIVSRYHAKITKEKEQYYITDLNSTNGTFLNKEPLQTYQSKEISFGDEIAFANIRYLFLQG